MAESYQIVDKAAVYVRDLLTTKSPAWAVFHTYEHTLDTVSATREIAEASKLDRNETEIVLLAAWFHDTGYTQGYDGHEEKSAAIAREFLTARGYPPERIDHVLRCIRATKPDHVPADLLEQVIGDADIIHLGKKRFPERNEVLRIETERREGREISDAEWLDNAATFVASRQFHTMFAREQYQDRKTKNLVKLQEMARAAKTTVAERLNVKELKEEKLRVKLEKAARPERGVETVFRVVPKNHLDLTGMADSKANMIITTNSLVISLVIPLFLRNIDENYHLVIPVAILLIVCLTAIIFSVLATRPKITHGTFTREEIAQKKANLLFFGNFHSMSLEDFEWGLNEMMKDRDYLYGNMIRDLHSLGKVLAVKYRYLRIAYNVFMYGLTVAVIAFIVAILMVETHLRP